MRVRQRVARAAALLAALTAVSQLLGLLRDVVIAAVYGAGAALDAYLVAQGLMNLVLALVAGAMARAVVPSVSRSAEAGDRPQAHRTLQVVLTLTLLVLVTGAVVMYAAAQTVVTVLAPGFDPQTRELAVGLARVMLVATVFVAGTDVLAAAAQAHGRFFHSGVQGVPFNLVMIAAAGWFGQQYGVRALAVGFVVGSAVRMLVQLPPLRGLGLRLRPRLSVRDPEVVEVLRLVPALLLTTAAVNVNTLVDRAVGSAQGEGVVAALSFGWRVVTLVDSLLVVTAVAALYPALGAAGTAERRGELRSLVTRAMRVLLVLLVPVVALLVLTAEPLVGLLFGRGDFGPRAVSLTALAVTGYAVAAAAIALRSIGSRACLAIGDARTPVVVALVVLGTNVTGDLTLGLAYGVAGLSASTSLSLAVGAAVVLLRLHRRHRAIRVPAVAAALARTTVAAAAAAGVCLGIGATRWPVGAAGELGTVLGLLGLGASLVLVYLAVLALLRSSELAELLATVREQLVARGRRGGGRTGQG